MITSTANAKIKRLVSLKKKRKAREQEGAFIVEGIRMAKEAPPDQIREIYVAQSFMQRARDQVEPIARLSGAPIQILTDPVFAHVSDTQTPQGILLVVGRKTYTQEDLLGDKALLLILENLQDPGNLGTLIRSAEAAGATGILASTGSVDFYSPKVVRSTMGSLFRVPFLYADDLISAMMTLKECGVAIYGASQGAETIYDQAEYRKAAAFLIGNEGSGLSEAAQECADMQICIPMLGKVESLNAAVAGSVLLFEAARQRRG